MFWKRRGPLFWLIWLSSLWSQIKFLYRIHGTVRQGPSHLFGSPRDGSSRWAQLPRLFEQKMTQWTQYPVVLKVVLKDRLTGTSWDVLPTWQFSANFPTGRGRVSPWECCWSLTQAFNAQSVPMTLQFLCLVSTLACERERARERERRKCCLQNQKLLIVVLKLAHVPCL